VAEVNEVMSKRSGDAGLEWLGLMGNGGTGGFVDDEVRETGGERECMYTRSW